MTGIFVAWTNRANSPGWIEDGTGCQIWVGCRNNNGYGTATVDGNPQLVHRVRYEREIGPIPERMQLDHFACDNGPGGCCNPFHCRPVTHTENMLRSDSASSLNLSKTHCPKGHPYSGANLYADRGRRVCKQCTRDRMRARYRARRAAAQSRDADAGRG